MNEVIIFHNSKCSKSRKTLELLQAKGVEPKIIEYLTAKLDVAQLEDVIEKLGIEAHELLRKKEDIFKTLALDTSSQDSVISAMIENPILIERPIVISGTNAVIGRPPENIEKLF